MTMSANIKALILAGGSGSRLRPMTNTSAKQLLPVANKPVLFYCLEAIAAAGISDAGIIVGDTARQVQDAVGDGSSFKLNVTYIRQDAPRGLAHAVLISRDYLGDDNFLMYLGDNIFLGDIASFTGTFCAERLDAQIMLARVPDARSFGVAEVDDAGRVIGVTEKPEHPKSDLAVMGIYMFTPAVHAAVRRLQPSWRGELEISDAIQSLIDTDHKVGSLITDGYWKDTGRVDDLLEVNEVLLENTTPSCAGTTDAKSELIGRVAIGAGARIRGSRIVGPALIGPGVEVTRSYVGPYTSVSAGCLIADSEIESSIVLEGTSIRGVRRIEHSLIGREVELGQAPEAPRAHKLVLGDQSKVQMGS
jgi:glucose-1-phosphate thymidylyltransferase